MLFSGTGEGGWFTFTHWAKKYVFGCRKALVGTGIPQEGHFYPFGDKWTYKIETKVAFPYYCHSSIQGPFFILHSCRLAKVY